MSTVSTSASFTGAPIPMPAMSSFPLAFSRLIGLTENIWK
jgi:hypothetical protein